MGVGEGAGKKGREELLKEQENNFETFYNKVNLDLLRELRNLPSYQLHDRLEELCLEAFDMGADGFKRHKSVRFENDTGKMGRTITVVEKFEFLFDLLPGLEEGDKRAEDKGDAEEEDEMEKEQAEDGRDKVSGSVLYDAEKEMRNFEEGWAGVRCDG